jgi:hypothetical protein
MDWSVVLIIVLAVAAVILGAIWYQQRRGKRVAGSSPAKFASYTGSSHAEYSRSLKRIAA